MSAKYKCRKKGGKTGSDINQKFQLLWSLDNRSQNEIGGSLEFISSFSASSRTYRSVSFVGVQERNFTHKVPLRAENEQKCNGEKTNSLFEFKFISIFVIGARGRREIR
jgi:hypothetical protein